ncbi:hypothetical protein pb186bvf_017963 [Paramecium bursaria]
MIYPLNFDQRKENCAPLYGIDLMKDQIQECIAHILINQCYLFGKILYLFLVWRNHQEFQYFYILPTIDLLNFIQNIREIVFIIIGDQYKLENTKNDEPLILELYQYEFYDRLTLREAIQDKFLIMTWLINLAYLGSIIYGIFYLSENYTADKIENLMIVMIIITSLNLILQVLFSYGYYEWKYRVIFKEYIKYKKQRYVDCSICLSEYNQGEELKLLQCQGKHIFHQKCIEQWFKFQNKCPNCRQKQ